MQTAVCQHYRQIGKTAPVLMLTAKDSTGDKVTGLDAGADDYLVKPVDVIELLARVRALGRRSPLWQGDTLSIGDLTLDLATMQLERQQKKIELSVREFQLLEYMLRNRDRVLARSQLESNLWEWGAEPESNAISTMVRRLRNRLKEVEAQDWIETIYGKGYRLRSPKG